MNNIRSILIALLLIPCLSFASGGQQTALDKLLDSYETKQRVANASAAAPVNLESENRKLKNQIIDLRVENDALTDQLSYVTATIENMEASESEEHSSLHDECLNTECVSLDNVMQEKLITYVIYSLGMYRIAELLDTVAPAENIEAHTKAQKIMNGVKRDLDVLGFDTSDMTDIPNLDELLEQLEITQGSMLAR